MTEPQNQNYHIALFKGKTIRKTIFNKEWWFSILDIIGVLTDSPQPKTYWAKMKERDREMSQPFPFWEQLKMQAEDEKMRETDCANTEGLFRIIQSIPSPKAEPLKRWLAKVGYERVQEIENPELATQEQKDYEILTAEISKATFGITPSEYKKVKGLKRQNLRDHMDDFELILTMLGERTTTEIHRTKDSHGLPRLKDDARVGGQIAGTARKQIERKIGRSVVSENNFLQNKNRKKLTEIEALK
ncbi:MAG: DNA-damage-inducible protein d [Candidatus Magasanikbacteria bacterium GW2011_GWA2_41_55]|uniref:DNA-damage-inducible protein d n=1 Tax=Candidatus Magasanikbacteria bacterium GW2011_GWA2_41_55 TaxID=1619038 RepID=A0A0G0WL24_9BACT|nr:MAG: DNA-damage-inducible protein d [Candidatus Magasanikbacteria bacterium GW2011_GWA2_41_55]